MTDAFLAPPPAPHLSTLPNGLRTVVLPMPWRATVALSVFVRTGSLHERPRESGLSHVVEHMAFKGTPTRSCQQLNLEAERLGAEVNAHTDKDHTAFHIEGLPQDLPVFVALLADIVRRSTFPADELERERQVILHELTEVQEDPAALAFQAFDRACYGSRHPAGRPIIGRRATIEAFRREDLLAYVGRQYGAVNVVVGAAGPLDAAAAQDFIRQVEAAFGGMPPGTPNGLAPAPWLGGLCQQRLGGSGQTQIVIGFPAPSLTQSLGQPALQAQADADVLAAALLGEGMSSPLLDELRERRGLAYHVACGADVLPLTGQVVIEAATSPAQADECVQAIAALLQRLAQEAPDPVGLERARRQLQVRTLRALESPARRLEAAAQDLYVHGALQDAQRRLDRVLAVPPQAVQAAFQRWRAAPAAVGLSGSLPQRLRPLLASHFRIGAGAPAA